ncbi:MAG: polysaccharide biosynthesis C-terminal domain-containing protein [Butyrivibrio sp.]|nr:polysaccharide biosynthesis C-terminal domain-containing protein [Butyrivibrio sp.]
MGHKLLARNTVTAIIYQVTSVLCGFVLPRLILATFGTQTNGLVSSITQFIQVINLFDLGISSVIVYNLYKPLATEDLNRLSKVVSAADGFFRIIGIALVCYIIILAVIYPVCVDSGFDYSFVMFLILIMGINAFGQYYLGVVNRLILIADQHNYIPYTTQTLTVIANTILCLVVVKLGGSIHAVKLVTSIVYLARPLTYAICVRNKYHINRRIKTDKNTLDQKWNGIAQHISSVILDSTDTIVLTLFSTLINVSIYNVYYLVIAGIKGFIISLTGGINSLLGNLWADNKKSLFVSTFHLFEWSMSMATVIVFGCVGYLLVPFVSLYTKDVNDANYIQSLFAFFLCLGYGFYSLRIPYSSVVLQIGHYKQTQNSYVISVLINISISIICVSRYGLVGVAVGTFLAMLFHTCFFQFYVYKRVINKSLKSIIRLYISILLSFLLGILINMIYMPAVDTVFHFIVACIYELLIWCFVTISINLVFYRSNFIYIFVQMKKT